MRSVIVLSVLLLVGSTSKATFVGSPPIPVSRTIINVNVIRPPQPMPITVGSHSLYGGCGGSFNMCGGGGGGGFRYAAPYYGNFGFSGYRMSCGHRHFRGNRCGHRGRCCRARRPFSFGFGFSSMGFSFGFNFARF